MEDNKIKALENVYAEKEKTNEFLKKFWINAAATISIMVVVLTIVLFYYNKGYCITYRLPATIKSLDLKGFIPLSLNAIFIFIYYVLYSSSIKSERKNKNVTINLERVVYSYTLILSLIIISGINISIKYNWKNILLLVSLLLLLLIVPVIIELMIYTYNHNASIEISKASVECEKEALHQIENDDKKFNEMIYKASMYHLCKRYGIKYLYMVIISCIFASIIGTLNSHYKINYETCLINNQYYAVVVDNKDEVVLQKATEKDDALTIDTSSYIFKDKEGMEFEYKYYDKVHIK